MVRKADAGFFVTGAAQAERGKECTSEYMTDRAKTATRPGAKKTSHKFNQVVAFAHVALTRSGSRPDRNMNEAVAQKEAVD